MKIVKRIKTLPTLLRLHRLAGRFAQGHLESALILAIGAIIRIAGYTASSLWYDEAVSLYRAQLPFRAMLTNPAEFSGNLLWQLVLRPFVAASDALWCIRLPALLLGLGTLWLAWRLMVRLEFGRAESIAASCFIAFLPGLIWVAQDARQYALLSFLLLLAANFAVDGRWLGLFASCGLLTYTHLVAPAYVLGPVAMALYLHRKESGKIILAGAGAVLLWLPYLLWSLSLPLGDYPVGTFSILGLYYSLWMMLWVGTISRTNIGIFVLVITLSAAAGLIGRARRQRAVLLLLAIPFAAMLVESILIRNVMAYRPLSGILVPLGLWLGTALTPAFLHLGKKIKTGIGPIFLNSIKVLLVICWMGLLVWGMTHWEASARGGHLAEAAQTICGQWQPGDVVYYATMTVALPFDYYLGDKPAYLMDASMNQFLDPPGISKFAYKPLEEISHRRAWVIYPLADEFTPEIRLRLQQYTEGGSQVATLKFPQVGDILVFLVPHP
jgi:hypothetical protein